VIRKVKHDMLDVGDCLFHKAPNVGVLDQIKDSISIPTTTHESCQAQLGEVLRHRCCIHADVIRQLVDGVLAMEQHPNDPQS